MATVRAEQLQQALKKELRPLYLLSGDEALLLQEARDSVRQAAMSSGVTERKLFQFGRDADWAAVEEEANSLGLFAQRKVLDIRFEKIDTDADTALNRLVGHLNPDDVLLVSAPNLNKAQQNKPWVKAAMSEGVFVQLWPIRANEMPRWLAARAQSKGLKISGPGIQFLAEQVEGNLLAAAQQIDLLTLLDEGQNWDLDDLAAAISDVARFDVFDLFDAAAAGDALRVQRMLEGLRNEGLNALSVVNPFASQLRRLVDVAQRIQSGAPAAQAFADARVYGRDRMAAWQKGVERFSVARLMQFVGDLRVVDQQVKGTRRGDAWLTLQRVLLGFCGIALLPQAFAADRYEKLISLSR